MSVFFRTTGTVAGPAFFLRKRGGGLRAVRMPVAVAVIERPDGLVLIDTGWSRRTCAWPDADPGRAAALVLGVSVKPEDAMASQLIGCGYAPDDVKHVIATHLHIDHVGGIVDFPRAHLHATTAEWDAVRGGRLHGYDPRTHALQDRTTLHDLRGPGELGFAASHDLFGDGTVLLLDASGHTAGSLAVAVQLEAGWLIHAGDAVMFREDYRDEAHPAPSLYARLLAKDLAAQRSRWPALLAAERGGATVVPSHDPEAFETLPKTREEGWKAAWERKPAKGTPKSPPPSSNKKKPPKDANGAPGGRKN